MLFIFRAVLPVLVSFACSGRGHRLHIRGQVQDQAVQEPQDSRSLRAATARKVFSAFLRTMQPASAWQASFAGHGHGHVVNSLTGRSHRSGSGPMGRNKVGPIPSTSRARRITTEQKKKSTPVNFVDTFHAMVNGVGVSTKKADLEKYRKDLSEKFAAQQSERKMKAQEAAQQKKTRARLRYDNVGKLQNIGRQKLKNDKPSPVPSGPFADHARGKLDSSLSREALRSRASAKYKTVPEGGHRSSDDLYYVVYKPFGVLSQFEDEEGRPTLATLGEFEKDVYPAGRLDMDSEGLLVLTNDGVLNQRILDPKYGHWRTYWVQVEGRITSEACAKLRKGVDIRPRKHSHRTLPAKCQIIDEPVELPERDPPVRKRQAIPTSWIELSIMEGKYRQVRKMLATVGFPVLRLVRVAVENLRVENFEVGGIRQYTRDEIYDLITIDLDSEDALVDERPLAVAR
mmetsp:Transcript_139979/g.241848  ORF Transcript_139979/g.241848 Transcript_139979/m.241848 type:complete len:457 (-) Transcript_139979:92-1462(-)